MEMRKRMRPCVMLSNIWPTSRETEGFTLAALEKAVAMDFFEAIQVVDIPYPDERKRFSEILSAHGLPGNMALTRVLNLNGLNLSSSEESLRKRSVDRIREELDNAREAGITRCTVVSGPRPASEEERKEGLRRFEESLDAICTAGEETPSLEILAEPLDFEADKRMTLGTVAEGVEIARNLKKSHSNFFLCIDTAHMLLNGEDISVGMETSREFLAEFHFCNPCLDRGHPLHGDKHLLLGPPGVVSEGKVVDWMREGIQRGIFTEDRRPTVAFEILQSDRMKGEELLAHCKNLFLRCWAGLESIPGGRNGA